MTITLNERMADSGPDVMYTSGFRQMIEDHLEYLRNHELTESVEINPQIAHKGDGDLISVLQDYSIPSEQHWIITRMNKLTSPMQYKSESLVLLVPSKTVLDNLLTAYRVSSKFNNTRAIVGR